MRMESTRISEYQSHDEDQDGQTFCIDESSSHSGNGVARSRVGVEKEHWQEQLRKFYTASLSSHHYTDARRRIFKQLVESLMYEGVIEYTSREEQGFNVWEIEGLGLNGERVFYACRGTSHLTFGRLRLNHEPITRRVFMDETPAWGSGSSSIQKGERIQAVEVGQEAESISLFLLEVGPAIGADEGKLLHFVKELEQTLINDTLARYVRAERQTDLHALPDEDWESGIIEGHPYHPSYKSRIGFRIEDQLEYGPEFRGCIKPIWVGIHKQNARISHGTNEHGPAAREWLQNQLGEQVLDRFLTALQEMGADPAEYVMMPVHPWQWRTTISSVLAEDIRNGSIVPLGSSEDRYTAQQSIRTLANRSRPNSPYLKLSLSMINTSTSRVIAPHTVENAPRITDWLQGISKQDPYLRDELRVILLGEIAGVAYDNHQIPDVLKPLSYGVLSCIWRESVHSRLEPGESAIPFNALSTLDYAGRPAIDPWVKKLGADEWLSELLLTAVRPLIHWLFAHGIALESHAQNMLLIHREGRPSRIALKDFHDGIRFTREALADPKLCPALVEVPEYHRRVNRNSFLETEEPTEVRDFIHDAFFFINLGELALFMHEHYQIREQTFWNKVRKIITDYQQHFPEFHERYERYSLFDPEIGVEQLTKRRMFPDDELRIHQVPNPLAHRIMDKFGSNEDELKNSI
ncbi:IucA/IucC family siderophore biosynthesis protein [Paenibacillus sp. LK1]|uniref:IucA/IucC family protein n=1 Tax=Paenibacillus sp. LK1 TaxID=2053014 RepID=UPI0015D50468|nr:IucA/IucC family protein [Paenibacillus sp. LK1]